MADATVPDDSQSSDFESLFAMIGGYAKTTVDTAVPVLAKDYATQLANGKDAQALAARLSNNNGAAGSNPNDLTDAAKQAAKTPGQKFSLMPYIYSSGNVGVLGWLLIAAVAFFGIRYLVKLTK